MLSQRIKYVVTSLLFALALLSASVPALAHGVHRGDQATAIHTSIQPDASSAEASNDDMTRHGMSRPDEFAAKIALKTSSVEPILALKSCDHAGGSGCCGPHAGCCGMSCCAAVLSVGAPALPSVYGPQFAASALGLFQSTYRDTLLRPPRPLL